MYRFDLMEFNCVDQTAEVRLCCFLVLMQWLPVTSIPDFALVMVSDQPHDVSIGTFTRYIELPPGTIETRICCSNSILQSRGVVVSLVCCNRRCVTRMLAWRRVPSRL